MANIVEFGLSNVYFAKATVSGGAVSYDTPKKIPGAVNLALTPSGGLSPFYADNIQYWRSNTNQGYEGSIEFALLTEDFRTDILGETLDANNVLLETKGNSSTPFALLYQVEGDDDEELRVMYFCEVSRPPVNAATITDSTEPQTVTLDITCSPRPDNGVVKGDTTAATTTTVASAWFTGVYE